MTCIPVVGQAVDRPEASPDVSRKRSSLLKKAGRVGESHEEVFGKLGRGGDDGLRSGELGKIGALFVAPLLRSTQDDRRHLPGRWPRKSWLGVCGRAWMSWRGVVIDADHSFTAGNRREGRWRPNGRHRARLPTLSARRLQ